MADTFAMLDTLHLTDLFIGPLITTFFLGIATFVLLSWYFYRRQTYWKEIGLPRGKVVRSSSILSILFKKPLHELEMDLYTKYGTIYGAYRGFAPSLAIAEPDILRQILVKDFNVFSSRTDFSLGDKMISKMVSAARGEDWKRIRTIMTPTFTTGKIKRMTNIFKECCQALVENFKNAAVRGEPVEVKSIYGAFSVDVIASTAFSTKIDSHNDPDNPFVQAAKTVFPKSLNWKLLVLLFCPPLSKFIKMTIFSRESVDFFTEVTLEIIKERKRTGQKRNDFLQLMLDTAKETDEENKIDFDEKDDILDNYGKEENDKMFKQNVYTKKTLSYDEMVAQCVSFFLGGYDTTANTLTFVSYNLALYPDIQEKVIQEIDDALKENNGELTYEAVQNMKYLDNVISETLRLYPSTIALDRIAEANYELKDHGLTIPKGMSIKIPVYAMHRDPQIYPDPEKFDPNRFTLEERAKRDLYTYLPFGHGPRNCVGMRFVLVEMKMCLASVLSNFRIKTSAQTKIPMEFHSGPGLLQPKDIYLSYELRIDAVEEL